MTAKRLAEVVADMERRRREYRQAVEGLRRVKLSATPDGDDPRWRLAAYSRDRIGSGVHARDSAAAAETGRRSRLRQSEDPELSPVAADLVSGIARRRYERQPGHGIRSLLDAAGTERVHATLVDISRGGAAFECEWDARPGMDLVIHFAGSQRRLRARVVRSSNAALAVSFVKDPDAGGAGEIDAQPASPPAEPGSPAHDGIRQTRPRVTPRFYRLRRGLASSVPALSAFANAFQRPAGASDRPPGPARTDASERGGLGLFNLVKRAEAITRDLETVAGRLRQRREQRKWLVTAGAGGVVGGIALWLVLVMSLPGSAGDWLASLPLGGNPWQAGQSLMRRNSPASWDKMVRLYTACGDQEVMTCEQAAMAARRVPAVQPAGLSSPILPAGMR